MVLMLMVTKDPPLSVLIGLHSVTLRDARYYRQNRITCGAHRISGATTHYQRYRIMLDAHYTIASCAMHITRGTEALSVASHGIEVLANISPITSHQPLASHNNGQRRLER